MSLTVLDYNGGTSDTQWLNNWLKDGKNML